MFISPWADYKNDGHMAYTLEKIIKGKYAGRFILGTCDHITGKQADYIVNSCEYAKTVDEITSGIKNGTYSLTEVD